VALDDEDDRPSGPPPAQDERSWRHPSEVDWTEDAARSRTVGEAAEQGDDRPPRWRSFRPGLWLGLMAALLAGTVVTVSAVTLGSDVLSGEDARPDFRPASTDARAVDAAATTVSGAGSLPSISGVGTAPWFGIDGRDLDAAGARAIGVRGGVVVAGLRPGGPAETAGIAVGDIVVRVHEHPVTTLSELRAAIGHHRPGDMLEVDLIRGDERLRLIIRLGAREDD
jgi:hypothetical protein